MKQEMGEHDKGSRSNNNGSNNNGMQEASKAGLIGLLLASAALPSLGAAEIRGHHTRARQDSHSAPLDPNGDKAEVNYPSRPRSLTSYGSTFSEGSGLQDKHYAIQRKVIAGEPVDPQQVVEFFDALGKDKKSTASVELVRHYMKNFPDDASSAAVLRFFVAAEYMRGSHETISRYAAYTNSTVVAYALLAGAESPEYNPGSTAIKKFQEHESADVRAAAIVLGVSKGVRPIDSDGLALTRASALLNDSMRHDGAEQRLGALLVKWLEKNEITTLSHEDLDGIKMPLLRFLQKTDARYPALLGSMDQPTLKLFLAEACKEIMDQRATLASKVLFGEGITLIGGLHSEEAFAKWRMQHVVDHYHMDVTGYYKGPSKKTEYLDALKAAGLKTDQEVLVWNCGHGGQNHFWFTNGQVGGHASDALHDPRNVSYREFAENLVLPQAKEIADGTRTGGIELGHMRIIFDACYQYDMAEKFHLEILRLAKEKGVEVKSFPVVITAAQKSHFGWYEPSQSATTMEMMIYAVEEPDDHSFDFGDFYRLDSRLNEAVNMQLPNSGLIRDAIDPAVFSSQVSNLDHTLSTLAERLRGQGVNIQMPELRNDIPENQNQVMEIGKRPGA